MQLQCDAAAVMQAAARRLNARRCFAKRLAEHRQQKREAVRMQAAWRAHVCHTQYRAQKRAAVALQAAAKKQQALAQSKAHKLAQVQKEQQHQASTALAAAKQAYLALSADDRLLVTASFDGVLTVRRPVRPCPYPNVIRIINRAIKRGYKHKIGMKFSTKNSHVDNIKAIHTKLFV